MTNVASAVRTVVGNTMLISQKNAVGCAECVFLEECGGLVGPQSLWGCFSHCLATCSPPNCDCTCPNNPQLFEVRFAEIEGDFGISATNLRVPTLTMPRYIPKIHNGSGRVRPLRTEVAALPAFALFSKRGSVLSPRFSCGRELRSSFKIAARTPLIISCISHDSEIEAIWSGLRSGSLAKDLARLKPAAVIAPNFSFFVDDVPRTHTLYNRKRICMASQALSEAGCPVVIPLLASTPHDWEFWRTLLNELPQVSYVAKEFQTGLSQPVAASIAIEDLARLQTNLGRALHPIAVGGGAYRRLLRRHFDNYTVIDSRAFLLTVKRTRIVNENGGIYSEISSPTPVGGSLDELMEWNLRARKAYITAHC